MRRALDDSALFVSRSETAPGVDLARVRQALREQRKMRITYADQNEAATERTIWPIMLGFIESQRFVAGWCELRANFGLFRTDQIVKVDFLEERYARSRRQLVKEWRAQDEHPCRQNDCS
jgi:predicted DNA-binding transcriptional regulator YafY